ncbi:MAG: DUF1648 domain-containing protein [Clostridia bacterium]|nr:DUF1648 domain-containing protein [Clostridia bacterium]
MKFIKWKPLLISCLVCLFPILIGLLLWDELPDTIAIHFDINNTPDNYTSKAFAVFGLPIMMAFLQLICCFINDIKAFKHGERKKFELVIKSIIPLMSIILQVITLGYSLGWNIDIRKAVALIVGAIFLVTGNYLPKLDYINNYDLDTEKARKINRFIGFGTVIMGILSLITAFLPAIYTLIWLFLLIPFVIVSIIYGVKKAK